MAKVQYMGTGRRKKSVARVRLVPRNGKVTINKREIENFFGLETLRAITISFNWTKDKFDVLEMFTVVDLQVKQELSDMVYLEH